MPQHEGWIVTADARHAALYLYTTTDRGRPHVERVKALENDREPKVERHRPYMLGRGPTANAVQHYASPGHVQEEGLRRFAREIMAWLAPTIRQLGLEHVSLFAAPRLLGMLREGLRELDRLEVGRQRVDLLEGELTHLQPYELADHPAVLDALHDPGTSGRRRKA